MLLHRSIRFAEVDQYLASLGFAVVRFVPRVFPNRKEPAHVEWENGPAKASAEFVMHVDPERRLLAIVGTDVEDVRAAVAHRLRLEDRGDLLAELAGADQDAAAYAVVALVDGWPNSSLVDVEHALFSRPEAHVQLACVKGLEALGTQRALAVLERARHDQTRTIEARAIAGAAASELRFTAKRE
ncbi:MAG: hypothetical protein ACI81R_001055 [Bradymonadia bacterium]|jgi:hypothetical protein